MKEKPLCFKHFKVNVTDERPFCFLKMSQSFSVTCGSWDTKFCSILKQWYFLKQWYRFGPTLGANTRRSARHLGSTKRRCWFLRYWVKWGWSPMPQQRGRFVTWWSRNLGAAREKRVELTVKNGEFQRICSWWFFIRCLQSARTCLCWRSRSPNLKLDDKHLKTNFSPEESCSWGQETVIPRGLAVFPLEAQPSKSRFDILFSKFQFTCRHDNSTFLQFLLTIWFHCHIFTFRLQGFVLIFIKVSEVSLKVNQNDFCQMKHQSTGEVTKRLSLSTPHPPDVEVDCSGQYVPCRRLRSGKCCLGSLWSSRALHTQHPGILCQESIPAVNYCEKCQSTRTFLWLSVLWNLLEKNRFCNSILASFVGLRTWQTILVRMSCQNGRKFVHDLDESSEEKWKCTEQMRKIYVLSGRRQNTPIKATVYAGQEAAQNKFNFIHLVSQQRESRKKKS